MYKNSKTYKDNKEKFLSEFLYVLKSTKMHFGIVRSISTKFSRDPKKYFFNKYTRDNI